MAMDKSLAAILPKSTIPSCDRLGTHALGVMRPLTVKSTLLTAEVAETRGLDPATATPSQAINAVAGKATDKKLSLTLAAARWAGSASPYTQGVTITGGTATSQADIQADATAIQQMLDDGTNAIYIANNNGTFTAYAVGEKPTADLSIQVTVYDVKEVS